MGTRGNFQKLINKKTQELTELEIQIRDLELRSREVKAYLQALEDSMKLLPRDTSAEVDHTLRPDTSLAKARDIIKTAGIPMPIAEILKAMGKQPDKKNRISLAGTLAGYARKGKVFTKTAPNTFGLVEFGTMATEIEDEIPEEFGKMQ